MNSCNTIELENLLVENLKGKFALLQSYSDREVIALHTLQEILSSDTLGKYSQLFQNDQEQKIFIKEFLSYGILEDLLCDSEVEDIVVNALKPIYIHHSQKGFIATEKKFETQQEFDIFINKLIVFSGRTEYKKIMNLELANLGGRVNIVSSPFGPQLTITKAKVEPLSIIDLIRRGGVSYEVAAQLWLYIDGLSIRPANIVIAGGPGVGKTTLLNALFSFVPVSDRMVIIEDTLELNTFLEDSCSRLETDEDNSLADLVRNSLRMRPERVIVGEVRGSEARDMITAVNIGKYCIGTIHALTSREAIIRLQNEPMNVPEMLINLVDVFVVLRRYHAEGKMFRVVDEVSETGGMEQKKVLLAHVFKYDYDAKKIKNISPSTIYRDRLAKEAGLAPREIINEVVVRAHIMRALDEKDAHTMKEVTTFCRIYREDPKKALSSLGLDRKKIISGINFK